MYRPTNEQLAVAMAIGRRSDQIIIKALGSWARKKSYANRFKIITKNGRLMKRLKIKR